MVSTSDIIKECEYFGSPKEFFELLPEAWQSVECQVLKLETRQEYIEKGNPSYELLASDKLNEAFTLIPEVRQEDVSLYKDLESRGVDFIRCRPIVYPLKKYLQWEIECYHFNANFGERIFFIDSSEWNSRFERFALHDFMVFDTSTALVHDYDELGEIKGGWLVKNRSHIHELMSLFMNIKARAKEYKSFLNR